MWIEAKKRNQGGSSFKIAVLAANVTFVVDRFLRRDLIKPKGPVFTPSTPLIYFCYSQTPCIFARDPDPSHRIPNGGKVLSIHGAASPCCLLSSRLIARKANQRQSSRLFVSNDGSLMALVLSSARDSGGLGRATCDATGLQL